jgi:tetratricopeptide (TPR) repeat protein
MNPDLGFAYFFLGNSYDKLWKPAKKGQADNDALLPKAVENYQIATQKIVNMPDPQGIRRLAYEYLIAAYGSDKLNDFSKAEAASKELITVEPDEPGNYQALARLYEDQGQYDEAEATFKKSIEVKPNDAVGYQLLAQYYNRQGQFDKMIDTLQERADKEPTNPEAWHTMATYYFEKVQRDKRVSNDLAKKYIAAGVQVEDKALALNPDYYDAVTYKSLLLALQAHYESDRGKINQLLSQADQLREQAKNLQKKQEKGK